MTTKKCKCGTEIREEQEICYECFKKSRNLREIMPDEIVFDCDDRQNGDARINNIGFLLMHDGYNFELYKANGQKSGHIHIKNIPHIAELSHEQNKIYKEKFIQKYKQKVVNLLGYEPKGLNKVDFSLCIPKHLIAEENKPHYKYRTRKELIILVNSQLQNCCDVEILKEIKDIPESFKPQIQKGTGITAQINQKINIVDIAQQFGLEIRNNKAICPFHQENKPSLVFYERQGRFCCFGCPAPKGKKYNEGNIILFYAMLKELKPNFKYKLKQESSKDVK